VASDGEALAVPGDDGDVDKVRLVTASLRACTTWPIVSRREEVERPEEARASVSFRSGWHHRIPTQSGQETISIGAQIKVKEGRPERGHSSPDLCRNRRITAAGTTDSDDEL
jgi:hypothetical protein